MSDPNPVKMRKFFFGIAILSLLGDGSIARSDAVPNALPVVRGFGISPRGFPLDYSQLPAFYAEVAGMPRGGVLWNGAWRNDVEGGTDAGVIPLGAKRSLESSAIYGYTPAVVFGWRSGQTLFLSVPGNPVNDWSNTDATSLFVSMLSKAGATYKPAFVFLGNENDFLPRQADR